MKKVFNGFRRTTSLLLILALVLSSFFPVSAIAMAPGGVAEGRAAAQYTAGRAAAQNASNRAAALDASDAAAQDIAVGGSFEIDPATLNVKKLGQGADDESGSNGGNGNKDGTLLPANKYKIDDIVRVSIIMEKPSVVDAGYSLNNVAAQPQTRAYRSTLRQDQNAVVSKINARLRSEIDVKWNLTLATNAISANVRFGDIIKIATVDGVKKVILEKQYEPPKDARPEASAAWNAGAGTGTADPMTANTAENMTGAMQAWADGYTGAGSKVAIIDTGADTNHQAFNADAFNYAISNLGKTVTLMTSNDLTAVKSQLNGNGAAYLSTKIPFAYNYVDHNTTVGHTADKEGEHGSHVAGIAAANRYIKSGTTYVSAAENAGAVGMAPDAQLLIMKVFGAGGGAYDSDYMAAIEDAIVLGCDAVNLSLGSSAQGFTFSDGYQDIMNKLTDGELNQKLVVSISAGNSGALTDNLATDLYIEDIHMHTGGSPGTFINSICVAAAENTITKGAPLVFGGSSEVYYSESTEGEDGAYSNPKMTTIASSNAYSYVYIDAVGEASEYSEVNATVSLSGKIVIVNRGSLNFSDKGNNAKSFSPKAVIVANNKRGTIMMDLSAFTGTFPMVTIKMLDALAIKESSAHGTTAGGIDYYTGTVVVTNTEKTVIADRLDAEVTDFSSWGIPGSLIMKPEITAPGGNIYSVNGTHQESNGSTAGGTTQYENMSGTSMAAPHITGLSAVVAQYIRENDIATKNPDLIENATVRAIVQSLLMSTATPMYYNGEYYSLLQQGAGLADVSKAVSASSVLLMDPDDDTLTAKTGAAADGKVKAELGDDPDRTGRYTYSFTIYNLTGNDLEFELSTDLFVQAVKEIEGSGTFMDIDTVMLPEGGVTYVWNGNAAAESHDVDRDGDTDNDDAQAILDYLAGNRSGSELDLTAADMDGDEDVTTYDAHLLIDWTPAAVSGEYVLPANGSAIVNVTINLTAAQKQILDRDYPCGTYVQGFTYAKCVTNGSKHEHSVPILGFYGSWTDPTMFDTTSYVEALYGSEQISYTDNDNTNYVRVEYGGAPVIFTGNPYMVEDEFPSGRLAVNSNSKFTNIAYNLVRAAGTTGFAVSKLDAPCGDVTSVLAASVLGNYVEGYYFDQEGNSYNGRMKTYVINKNAASYGLSEGDAFRIGFYAIPEYNAMIVNDDYSSENAGLLGGTGFRTLLTSNVLGRGAFVGYDFTVDNTDPVLDAPVLSGSSITVSASDNLNLAYVAVLSLDGETVYSEAAPGAGTYSVTFDASNAIANAHGYVAVFAADYAGNEVARALKVNDNTYEEKTVYVLTSALTAGEDYLIVSRDSAGSGYALGHSGTTVATNAVNVKAGNTSTGNAPFIESIDVAGTSVWTVSGSYVFKNGSYYLRANIKNNSHSLQISTTSSNWSWDATNSRLSSTNGNKTCYLRYSNNTFSINTTASSIYLYRKTVIRTEVDPFAITSVKITPDTLDLYKGNTADLSAKVLPLTASDRTVSWSSSNTNVVTVDQRGHVNAIAEGSATITATANGNNAVSASATVNVLSVNKSLNAIVWDEQGDIYFSSFNASSLPVWKKLHNDAKQASLQSAFMANASTLYAGSLDMQTQETVLYSVNRTNYAIKEFGTNYVMAFDMARASSQYTGYFVYSFAYYLIFGNLTPEEDEEGTFSGIPYGLLDASKTIGENVYIAAVAASSVGTTSSSFYFLDENGIIWQSKMSIGNSVTFSTPTKVVDTGIPTPFLYQNLYYDGTYLYWSHTDGDIAELIIINPKNGKVYHAGDFGENVWPVGGIYVDGSVAPAAVGSGNETLADGGASSILSGLKPVATRDELLTAHVIERINAEAAAVDSYSSSRDGSVLPSKSKDAALTNLPGTGASTLASSGSSAADPALGQSTLTVTDSVPVSNGLIRITYDPAKLTYVSAEAAAPYNSVGVNAASGEILIAFASAAEIQAGSAIATVVFDAGCTDADVTISTIERNADLSLSESVSAVVNGCGHSWGAPSWSWSDDLSTATATFVCEKDGTHVVSVTDDIIVRELRAPADNSVIYTYARVAEVTGPDGEVYTDERTQEGLFAGWYTDETFAEYYTSAPEDLQAAYAKLVDPDILKVKFQLKNSALATDESTVLRVLTTVDTLNYSKVGFVVTYTDGNGNAVSKTFETSTVYKKITGTGELGPINYEPTVFSPDSTRFCAFNLTVPCNLFAVQIKYTPFWTTCDGTTVLGQTGALTLSGHLH